MQALSSDWFTFGDQPEDQRSPAYDHQFGNPDTKHGPPGADTKAEAMIRNYVPGYSGHSPAVRDEIGGGMWKPTVPYKTGDSPQLVDKHGKLVKQNFTQGLDWDPDGDGKP